MFSRKDVKPNGHVISKVFCNKFEFANLYCIIYILFYTHIPVNFLDECEF